MKSAGNAEQQLRYQLRIENKGIDWSLCMPMHTYTYKSTQSYAHIYTYIYIYVLCVRQTKNLHHFFLPLRFWLWIVSATFNPCGVRVSNFHIQWRSLASRLVSNWRMTLVYLNPSFSRISNIWNLEILTSWDFMWLWRDEVSHLEKSPLRNLRWSDICPFMRDLI